MSAWPQSSQRVAMPGSADEAILFTAWMAAAFADNRSARLLGGPVATGSRIRLDIYLLVALTVLMIGLRFEVGGDWFTYLDDYNNATLLSFSQVIASFDPGYRLRRGFNETRIIFIF